MTFDTAFHGDSYGTLAHLVAQCRAIVTDLKAFFRFRDMAAGAIFCGRFGMPGRRFARSQVAAASLFGLRKDGGKG
jgi:hypothetical protein